MIKVKFNQSDLSRVNKKLAGIQKYDPLKALILTAADTKTRQRKHFKGKGRSGVFAKTPGLPWAKRSPYYLKRNFVTWPIMINTGALMWGFKINASGNRVKVVNKMDYSAAQHYGSIKRNLPARPLMIFDKKTKETLIKHIKKDLKAAGEDGRPR